MECLSLSSVIRNDRGRNRAYGFAARAYGATVRCAIVLLILPGSGIGDTQTTIQTLSATISPAGKISVPASVTLTSSGTYLGAFSGSPLVSYWAVTSGGGGGSVAVQASSEFSPTGGPTAGAVTYSLTGAALGTGCSGTQTIQTSSQTSVVSLPAACAPGEGARTATGSAQLPSRTDSDATNVSDPHTLERKKERK